VFIGLNLASDALYRVLDPRTRDTREPTRTGL